MAYSTLKIPVSLLAVERLLTAGLLGRVSKKKPYPRLANGRNRLKWAKENRYWMEDD